MPVYGTQHRKIATSIHTQKMLRKKKKEECPGRLVVPFSENYRHQQDMAVATLMEHCARGECEGWIWCVGRLCKSYQIEFAIRASAPITFVYSLFVLLTCRDDERVAVKPIPRSGNRTSQIVHQCQRLSSTIIALPRSNS